MNLSPVLDAITNDRLVDMSPCWAEFRGFSLLFDNPTHNLHRRDGILKLSLRVATARRLLLYKAFADSLQEIRSDILTNEFMLGLLPPSTYHVTVWNGVNDANVTRSSPDFLPRLRSMLTRLPDSIAQRNPLFNTIQKSSLVTRTGWSLDFVFDRLDVWRDLVLVARLKPANSPSCAVMDELVKEAGVLSDSIGRMLGMDMSQRLNPHVTIGYYANKSRAQRSFRELEKWNAIFCRKTDLTTVTYNSIGLYAFTDMASFFRRPNPSVSNGSVRQTPNASDIDQ